MSKPDDPFHLHLVIHGQLEGKPVSVTVYLPLTRLSLGVVSLISSVTLVTFEIMKRWV